MNRKIHLFLFLLPVLSFAEPSLPAKARVTGDNVRVRTEPSLTAPVKGVLFKNMTVTVSARDGQKTKVGDKEDFWYRVEGEGSSGWSYGGFLDFAMAGPAVDTYEGNPDLTWFFNRFGTSTWEYQQKISTGSFTLDEYRSLMTGVSAGDGSVGYAVRYSLLERLKGGSTLAEDAYLGRKVFSREFLSDMMKSSVQHDLLCVVPDPIKKNKAFVMLVLSREARNFPCVQDVYAGDREVSLAAVKGDSHNMGHLSDGLKDDPVFVLDAVRGVAGRAVLTHMISDRLKNDRAFMLKILQISPGELNRAIPKFQDDKELALISVRSNGWHFVNVSKRLKDDEDVARAAQEKAGNDVIREYASPRLKEKLLPK